MNPHELTPGDLVSIPINGIEEEMSFHAIRPSLLAGCEMVHLVNRSGHLVLLPVSRVARDGRKIQEAA